MDNKELYAFGAIQRLNDLRRANDALLAHTEAEERAKLDEKRACDLLFAACQEFKLIERNMTCYPLWSALRLMGLYEDSHNGRARLDYAMLKILEPHVPTNSASFPLPQFSFGPFSQENFSSLEFKQLLTELNCGIQNSLSKCLADNPDIPIDTLKAAIRGLIDGKESPFLDQRYSPAVANHMREKANIERAQAIQIIAELSGRNQIPGPQHQRTPPLPTTSNDIEFRCDKCGKKLSIDSSWRGSIVECPVCKRNTAVS